MVLAAPAGRSLAAVAWRAAAGAPRRAAGRPLVPPVATAPEVAVAAPSALLAAARGAKWLGGGGASTASPPPPPRGAPPTGSKPMGDYTSLTMLGAATPAFAASPAEAVLERVPNAHPGTPYVARFTAPEFTSLCPVTGAPDFAHLVIDYVPGDWLVESKSLKLYLTSFRNHGDFHEACTVAIGRRLVETVAPVWARVGGYWYPRGGIPIDVFWSTGEPPAGVWVPEQGVPGYRGRG